MTKMIDRGEVERLYADMIVDHGNPHYFIFKVIREWEDYELEDAMNEFGGEKVEIVEDEE